MLSEIKRLLNETFNTATFIRLAQHALTSSLGQLKQPHNDIIWRGIFWRCHFLYGVRYYLRWNISGILNKQSKLVRGARCFFLFCRFADVRSGMKLMPHTCLALFLSKIMPIFEIIQLLWCEHIIMFCLCTVQSSVTLIFSLPKCSCISLHRVSQDHEVHLDQQAHRWVSHDLQRSK